jgi:hypothetical protein
MSVPELVPAVRQLNNAFAVDFYCDEFPAPLLLLVCCNVLRIERYSGDRMPGRDIAESDSNEPEMRSALAERIDDYALTESSSILRMARPVRNPPFGTSQKPSFGITSGWPTIRTAADALTDGLQIVDLSGSHSAVVKNVSAIFTGEKCFTAKAPVVHQISSTTTRVELAVVAGAEPMPKREVELCVLQTSVSKAALELAIRLLYVASSRLR